MAEHIVNVPVPMMQEEVIGVKKEMTTKERAQPRVVQQRVAEQIVNVPVRMMQNEVIDMKQKCALRNAYSRKLRSREWLSKLWQFQCP